MALNVLQLTDFHIFSDPNTKFLGVPTIKTLQDVLVKVVDLNIDFDHIIITGDLTSDEELISYQTVKELLGNMISKCKIIPGNHDDRKLIRKVFPECVENENGPINFSISTNSWQLLGLDTHIPGEMYGTISTETLCWLKNMLDKHKNKPTILFQHHPPVHVQTKWADLLGLKNTVPFIEILNQNPQIRLISCGHVHQEFQGTLGNITIFTTPSTGTQFQKGTDMLKCDPIPPGFRIFSFDNDSWESKTIRLDELKYPPVKN